MRACARACVRACVCVFVLHPLSLGCVCVRVCVCVCARVCVLHPLSLGCACVCERARVRVCVCVCFIHCLWDVCVCAGWGWVRGEGGGDWQCSVACLRMHVAAEEAEEEMHKEVALAGPVFNHGTHSTRACGPAGDRFPEWARWAEG